MFHQRASIVRTAVEVAEAWDEDLVAALTDIGGWKRKFDFGQWHTPNDASSRISGKGEKRVATVTLKYSPVDDLFNTSLKVSNLTQKRRIHQPDTISRQAGYPAYTSYAKAIQAQQAPRTPKDPLRTPLPKAQTPESFRRSTSSRRRGEALYRLEVFRPGYLRTSSSQMPGDVISTSSPKNDARDRVGSVGIGDSICTCEQKKKGKANRTSSLPLDGRLVLRYQGRCALR
ncbi:hypothetical protein HO133_006808 [Letharia lupina]|uniref:Uncharacterized protein n=1 Tax=Letharia lupina TaxID=560253 RepID=A0A8H6C4F9_9LECA|nr:uncharacterized protein HO133_006808 [Letharia lupina]KAF6217470.1 hypothetical protein HO133_006808 [Letharia lupina]